LTTVILQIYIHFVWTISTSWVMPVIGYKENKDDDDDDVLKQITA
jgi:hypothetical protein